MNSKFFFYALVTSLFLLGTYQTVQRHLLLEVPWFPGENRAIWNIDAKIEFAAQGESVIASLSTPSPQAGFSQLSQNAASPGYGLSFLTEDKTPQAQWTIREASGKQTLYYNVQMLVDPKVKDPQLTEMPALNKTLSSPVGQAVEKAIIDEAHAKSADAFSFTRELLKALNDEDPDQNVRLILNSGSPKEDVLIRLLSQAEIPAKKIGALNLEDARRNQQLKPIVEVFQTQNDVITSQLFDPNSAQVVNRENLLLWDQTGKALLELTGGDSSAVSFSMLKQNQPALSVIMENPNNKHLFNFSIHSLPIEDQSVFKGILIIPLGVLVVVLMRVLVGVKTSGTFMPVLIAMAFIQTSLITGMIAFILLVTVGLFIRSYLSHLNLLLVSRISTVIIMVILLIALFGVLSYELGLSEGLKITFFPMIILAWTIERMSVLWEEEGMKEVLTQGGGSLIVAVMAYFIMSNELMRHLMFNFIGLQFVVMAFVLLLGSYTGYRLLELYRFKPLVEKD